MTLTRPYDPVSRVVRAVGRPVGVDFVLALSSGKSFESIRSRATPVKIGRTTALVASLEDIIEAKEAAGRTRDNATLPMLKDALRVRDRMKRNRTTD